MSESKPPQMMSFPGVLRFSADGRWYHDDTEVTHAGIRDYFSKHLRFVEELGHFAVEVAGRGVVVAVEDTRAVVIRAEQVADRWHFVLSTGLRLEAGGCQLLVVNDTRWYLCQPGETERARISWSVVQFLLPHLEQDEAGMYTVTLEPGVTLELNTARE